MGVNISICVFTYIYIYMLAYLYIDRCVYIYMHTHKHFGFEIHLRIAGTLVTVAGLGMRTVFSGFLDSLSPSPQVSLHLGKIRAPDKHRAWLW